MKSNQSVLASGERFPDLPDNLRPLHHQVAGHVYDRKRIKLGILECGDNTILKPLQEGRRGESELGLYQSVVDTACTNPTLRQLRLLVPHYLGTINLQQHPDVTYLHLEDITAGFVRPCVADVKLGRRTYDPLAGAQKIAVEIAKYPPAQALGFQFRGMRAYDDATDTFTTAGKELRSFTEDNIQEAFVAFFSNSGGLRLDAVAACLAELRPLFTWFQQQTQLAFYASSVLMIYEGMPDRKAPVNRDPVTKPLGASDHPDGTGQDHSNLTPSGREEPARTKPDQGSLATPLTACHDCHPMTNPGQSSHTRTDKLTAAGDGPTGSEVNTRSRSGKPTCLAKVRLIDFAHVFPADHVDENNLHGLCTLVRLLETLLSK